MEDDRKPFTGGQRVIGFYEFQARIDNLVTVGFFFFTSLSRSPSLFVIFVALSLSFELKTVKTTILLQGASLTLLLTEKHQNEGFKEKARVGDDGKKKSQVDRVTGSSGTFGMVSDR